MILKINLFCILCAFTINFQIRAQASPFELGLNGLRDHGYLYALTSLQEQENYYLVENKKYKQSYLQIISTFYSFLGENENALKKFDEAFVKKDLTEPIRPKDSIILPENIEFRNAVEELKKLCVGKRIIIINESHMVPQHRVLTRLLLEPLAKDGFNYLAIEGLSRLDSTVNERGYPVVLNSGFYLNEPAYGNLLREGIKKKYKVFPYDVGPSCDYNSEKPNYCNNLREFYQALEISKIVDSDSSAKIIIHCGLSHLQEKTNTDWIKMAEYLKILTGIDPLTINQTKFNERGYPQLETDIYHSVSTKINGNSPVICQNNGTYWVPKKYEGFFDIQVFWPRISYEFGRPSYLFLQSDCQKYNLSTKKAMKGTLVQAFDKNEKMDPVPIDQVLIKKDHEKTVLILPKGRYVIKIKNNIDEIVDSFDIEIK